MKSVMQNAGRPKRQMQNVSFSDMEAFFDFLPERELKLVRFLRSLIMECIPGCKEKLSWNVPFYYRHANICFLWPSSVTWGNVKQGDTVRLGFTKGYLLQDEIGYLDKGDRKEVYWHDFTNIKEIDTALLKAYLFEAGRIDEEIYLTKKNAP